MTENDQIAAHLKKKVHDLTYYEKLSSWTKADHSQKIHDLCVEINAVCRVMEIIGQEKFWIHKDGIEGFGGQWVNVRKRFNLFGSMK